MTRAIARHNLGEYDQARTDLLHARDVREDAHGYLPKKREACVMHDLGEVDFKEGILDRALEYCQASLRVAAQLSDFNIVALDLALAAGIAARLGQTARAALLCGAAQALYARRHLFAQVDLDHLHLIATTRPGPAGR